MSLNKEAQAHYYTLMSHTMKSQRLKEMLQEIFDAIESKSANIDTQLASININTLLAQLAEIKNRLDAIEQKMPGKPVKGTK